MKTLKPALGLLLASLIAPAIAPAQQYTISTVAGDGNQGFLGDGGPAIYGGLDFPTRIAFDSKGNYYIADYLSYIIRKVDTTGNISTVAGNLTQGYAGDGAPANQAKLSTVHGLAVDSSGNLFIADTGNSVIRRVDATSGNISTFAGNNILGYSGDGGAAGSAQLERPGAIAFDSTGNLYIPDYAASVIRKVDTSGKISTFAGTGAFGNTGDGGAAAKATFGAPVAVTVDAAGNIYVSDTSYGTIRKITSDGNIRTVATGVNAQTLAVDSAGNIYFPDYLSNTVRKVTPAGASIAIAGTGLPALNGDGGLAINAALNQPTGIVLGSSGKIYVADSGNHSIRLLTPVTTSLSVLNAASNLGGAVSPGEIVVIYGTGIGPSTLVSNTPVKGVYGTQAGGTTVSFDGNPAAILYASATQVAAIVPYEEFTGITANVVLKYQSTTLTTTVPVAWTAPGLFTADSSGSGQAAAVNQNGTLNGPSNPAKVGSFISLYGTGEGYTTPTGVDGQLAANPAPVPVRSVAVTVNGQSAAVSYAGGSPGTVQGLVQINVQIPQIPPALLTSGPISVPVVVLIDGRPSQTLATISVSN